ncbi:MAG: fibronectin type III domain-containing protein [Oscillospiraceae bacterium]|nr:fibronectin type III domain-containing protein [Oscillospiraceae bacterium]
MKKIMSVILTAALLITTLVVTPLLSSAETGVNLSGTGDIWGSGVPYLYSKDTYDVEDFEVTFTVNEGTANGARILLALGDIGTAMDWNTTPNFTSGIMVSFGVTVGEAGVSCADLRVGTLPRGGSDVMDNIKYRAINAGNIIPDGKITVKFAKDDTYGVKILVNGEDVLVDDWFDFSSIVAALADGAYLNMSSCVAAADFTLDEIVEAGTPVAFSPADFVSSNPAGVTISGTGDIWGSGVPYLYSKDTYDVEDFEVTFTVNEGTANGARILLALGDIGTAMDWNTTPNFTNGIMVSFGVTVGEAGVSCADLRVGTLPRGGSDVMDNIKYRTINAGNIIPDGKITVKFAKDDTYGVKILVNGEDVLVDDWFDFSSIVAALAEGAYLNMSSCVAAADFTLDEIVEAGSRVDFSLGDFNSSIPTGVNVAGTGDLWGSGVPYLYSKDTYDVEDFEVTFTVNEGTANGARILLALGDIGTAMDWNTTPNFTNGIMVSFGVTVGEAGVSCADLRVGTLPRGGNDVMDNIKYRTINAGNIIPDGKITVKFAKDDTYGVKILVNGEDVLVDDWFDFSSIVAALADGAYLNMSSCVAAADITLDSIKEGTKNIAVLPADFVTPAPAGGDDDVPEGPTFPEVEADGDINDSELIAPDALDDFTVYGGENAGTVAEVPTGIKISSVGDQYTAPGVMTNGKVVVDGLKFTYSEDSYLGVDGSSLYPGSRNPKVAILLTSGKGAYGSADVGDGIMLVHRLAYDASWNFIAFYDIWAVKGEEHTLIAHSQNIESAKEGTEITVEMVKDETLGLKIYVNGTLLTGTDRSDDTFTPKGETGEIDFTPCINYVRNAAYLGMFTFGGDNHVESDDIAVASVISTLRSVNGTVVSSLYAPFDGEFKLNNFIQINTGDTTVETENGIKVEMPSAGSLWSPHPTLLWPEKMPLDNLSFEISLDNYAPECDPDLNETPESFMPVIAFALTQKADPFSYTMSAESGKNMVFFIRVKDDGTSQIEILKAEEGKKLEAIYLTAPIQGAGWGDDVSIRFVEDETDGYILYVNGERALATSEGDPQPFGLSYLKEVFADGEAYFQITAFDNAGTAPITFTLKDLYNYVPQPGSTTGTAVDVKADSATLTGDFVDVDEDDVVSFGFEYKEKGAAEWTKIELTAGESTRVISELKAKTTYVYRTYVDQAGTVAYGEEVEFTTAAAQEAPDTGDSATIAWGLVAILAAGAALVIFSRKKLFVK